MRERMQSCREGVLVKIRTKNPFLNFAGCEFDPQTISRVALRSINDQIKYNEFCQQHYFTVSQPLLAEWYGLRVHELLLERNTLDFVDPMTDEELALLASPDSF